MGAVAVKDLDYVLEFGKYGGKTVKWVLENNPSYLVWAHDTISWFKVKKEIYEEAVNALFDEEMRKFTRTTFVGHNYSSYYDDDPY